MYYKCVTEPVSDQLIAAIEQAREQVPLLVNDHLPFKYVMSILACFGSNWYRARDEESIARQLQNMDETTFSCVRGWQRRAWNALLSAEKLAPLWRPKLVHVEDIEQKGDQLLIDNFNYTKTLEEGKQAVFSVSPLSYAYPFLDPMADHIVYWANFGQKSDASLRASASYGALESALHIVGGDEKHDFSSGTEYPLNWDGDWYGIPSVYYSATAFSCTRMKDRSGRQMRDKERLQEFWFWWLDEAVPASWFLRDVPKDDTA